MVLLPSFTFSASPRGRVERTGTTICRLRRANFSSRSTRCRSRDSATPARSCLRICSGHLCAAERFEALARRSGTRPRVRCRARLRRDATGPGSRRMGRREVFSLSPTKVLTAGEGGLVAPPTTSRCPYTTAATTATPVRTRTGSSASTLGCPSSTPRCDRGACRHRHPVDPPPGSGAPVPQAHRRHPRAALASGGRRRRGDLQGVLDRRRTRVPGSIATCLSPRPR